jgi:uncharacterized RDD family membrane protein YckC
MESDAPTRYAGLGRRLAAALIDAALLLPLLAGLLYAVYGRAYFDWLVQRRDPLALYGTADALITQVLPAALVVGFWVKLQGTPGKLLLGCRVVNAVGGGPLSLRQALLRCLGYLVSTLPLLLGFVWIAFDRRRQGLHDKLASSLVILAPAPAPTREPAS